MRTVMAAVVFLIVTVLVVPQYRAAVGKAWTRSGGAAFVTTFATDTEQSLATIIGVVLDASAFGYAKKPAPQK